MNLRIKLKEVVMQIKHSPDSDDVCSIVRNTIDELIDEDIMGLELQLALLFIQQELRKMLFHAEDYIEVNNLKRGIEYTEHFKKIFGMKIYHYELN